MIRERSAPFEHVFVATDFSAGAARALARAGGLPLAEGGKITIGHVLSDRLPKQARGEAEMLADRALDEARDAIRSAAAAAGRTDVEVHRELLEGQPYLEIVRRARAVGAELIVVGRHGRRPVRDMFIGSTAERAIRASELPVLVVSRTAGRPYRRPLVAVDLEETCASVISTGLRVVGPEVTSGIMVHAYHVPFEGLVTPGASPGQMTDLRREYRRTALTGLTKLHASLGQLGFEWRTAIVRGDARSAILAEAVRRRADLVVVGTHGRSGIAHALIGSVAEWIVRAAACDVLVARPWAR